MIDSRAPLPLRYVGVWAAPWPHCTVTAVHQQHMRTALASGIFWLHFSTMGARESAPSIFIQVCDLQAIWCDLSAKRKARVD